MATVMSPFSFFANLKPSFQSKNSTFSFSIAIANNISVTKIIVIGRRTNGK